MIRKSHLLAGVLVLAALFAAGTIGYQRYAAADNQGLPHIELDADPTNGTGPCHPIDATRTVPASGDYDVAFCLDENAGAPDAFEVTLTYSGPVSATNVADVGDGLDDNPDFNQAAGPTGNGTNWSCNSFGLSFPTVGPPAHLVCNEKNFAAGMLTDTPGLLGTFHVTATGSGDAVFAFSTDGSSSVNSPAGSNNLCGGAVTCPGGTVTQGAAGPTNTSTSVPATNTSTATNTSIPVNTATNTSTPTSTSVPVNTATNTATPTNTSVVPVDTATNTATATETSVIPVDTATNTATSVPGDTATSTSVPVDTATSTSVPEETATDTPVVEATATDTPVGVATATDTPVVEETATNTSVPEDTATSTSVPTETNTSVPVDTATATNTPATSQTPARTGTPARTATAQRTATARATRTATPRPEEHCADVTGDGKVTIRDVIAIARHLHSGDLQYDVNGDGHVNFRDVVLAVEQLGRRCGESEHVHWWWWR